MSETELQAENLPKEDFSRRLRNARKSLGKTLIEFGSPLKIGNSHISRMENGESAPSFHLLLAIEHIWGVSSHWLETGQGEMFVGRPQPEIKFITPDGRVTDRQIRDLGAYYPLPLVGGELAAGVPLVVDEHDIQDYIPSPYHKDWCPHPTRTVCVRVRGDSMTPTIPDGGLVAIDLAQKNPPDLIGHIAALRADDGVTIKRLALMGEHIVAAPDNPRSQEGRVYHGDEIADAVIGKIVWWWGRSK